MKIVKEVDCYQDFEAWSGGEATWNYLHEQGLDYEFLNVLEELYPDGITETQLNDMLWFDGDWCCAMVGLDRNAYDEEIEL